MLNLISNGFTERLQIDMSTISTTVGFNCIAVLTASTKFTVSQHSIIHRVITHRSHIGHTPDLLCTLLKKLCLTETTGCFLTDKPWNLLCLCYIVHSLLKAVTCLQWSRRMLMSNQKQPYICGAYDDRALLISPLQFSTAFVDKVPFCL